MSIHRKPSNADGHSEGQTRTARETIPSKKGDQLLPMRLERGQIGGPKTKSLGEHGGEQCSARQAMQKDIRLSRELYLLWS